VPVVGSLLRNLLYPQVDAPPGPDSLRVTGRDEGDPVYQGFGTEVPVAGTLIWFGPLKKKTSGGGKGGGGKGEAPTTTYKVDCAVAFMRQPTDSLRKLWMGGDLVYDADADVSIVGTTFTATRYQEGYIQDGGSPGIYENLDLASSSATNNLGLLKPGFDCTVSGFTSAGNNGTFRVVAAYQNADGTSNARLRKSSGNAVNEAAGDTVTITQNLPEYSAGRLDSITFFDGADDQLPSSLIEAVEGTGNVPGWRGWTYIVIQNLNVTKWGGSFPECRALIRERTTCTLADAVTAICTRGNVTGGVNITADDIDVTALTGVTVRGIAASGPTAGAAMLSQLAGAYNLDAQERDGKIVFFLATAPSTVTVADTKWGAHEQGEQPPSRLPVRDVPRQTLPNQVDVVDLARDRDWQDGDTSFRMGANPRNIVDQVSLNVVLTRSEADAIAKKLAVRSGYAARVMRTFVAPELVEVCEGDNLLVTDGADTTRFRVERVARGVNGLVEVEGPLENLASLTQSVTTETGAPNAGGGSPTLPTEVAWAVLDIPPLSDAAATVVGLYVGAGSYGPNDPFVGASVFRSLDAGVNYGSWHNQYVSATFGVTSGTLGAGSEFFKDTTNTLTVVLYSDTAQLDSMDDAAVLLGSNRLLVGLEVVGFTVATLTAPRTYQLTGLYRGLNGTHDKTSGHSANEPVVLLSDGAVEFVEIGVSGIGAPADYKGVPAGGDLDDFISRTLTPIGKSAQPLDVYAVAGSRDGSNNLTITWNARSRGSYNVITGGLPPLMDGTERYEVDILDGSTVVRTISVSAATTTTYSAANQTTDGLTPGNPVSLVIYQMGDLVGRGRASAATV
jgi:hypothetical protein